MNMAATVGAMTGLLLLLFFGSTQPIMLDTSPEFQLHKDLFENYNSNVRPTFHPDRPTQILLQFALKRIESLNEKDQHMICFAYLTTIWMDDFLRWNPGNYSGLDEVVVPGNMLWLPEIVVYNSAENNGDLSLSLADAYRVEIHSDGRIIWVPGNVFNTECSFEMFSFPFDTQTCEVIFVNWVYKQNIEFVLSESGSLVLDAYTPTHEWDLIGYSSKNSSMSIRTENSTVTSLSTVIFSVQLQRNPVYYILLLMVPALLLCVIAVAMFWLPPGGGERVSFGITIMLAFSILMLTLADITPKTGTGIPLMMYYVFLCMVLTALSLMLSVAMIHLTTRLRHGTCTEKVVLRCLSKMACFQYSARAHTGTHDESFQTNAEKTLRKMSEAVEAGGRVEQEPMCILLQKMLDRIERMDHIRLVDRDWGEVCLILDKLLFWVFFLVLMLLTVVMIVLISSNTIS